MCFACAVGNWPSCNSTVGRKMRIVACLNRCNSKPMGAFNTTKIPVEMLEIPLANGTIHRPDQSHGAFGYCSYKRAVFETTILSNGKGHSNIADLNLNSSDLTGSLFKFSLQLNQSGLSVLTDGINRNLSWLKKMYLLFSLNFGRHISYKLRQVYNKLQQRCINN